jgi:hypothetical protein
MPSRRPPAPPRRIEYLLLDEIESASVNPKRHDRATIDESIERFGVVDVLVLDDRTGRLVAGHGRRDTLRDERDAGKPAPDGIVVDAEGRWRVPVVVGWSSADDVEAHAAGVALNRLTERGGWDPHELHSLLVEIEATSAGLIGIGYSRDEIDELLSSLDTTPPEPPPETDPEPPMWGVIIECQNESAQRHLLQRFIDEGLAARALMRV